MPTLAATNQPLPELRQCPRSFSSPPARAALRLTRPASPPNSPPSCAKRTPASTLVVRDLVANPLPHIDPDYSTGIYTPAEARTQRQAEVVAVSDAALDELFAADTVILATGFINFGISSTLKSWIDHISRSGRSFSYGENGPKGLVTGKKVYIVLASGGIYSEGAAVQMDHAIPYLRSVLGFMGMTDVEVIRVEGVGMGAEATAAALDKATARIEALVAEPRPTSPPRPDTAAVQTKGRRRTAPAFCPIPVRRGPRPSAENALALLVDDLLALAERHVDRIVERGEAVGADEAMLLQNAVDLLRDDAAGLVLAVILVGRGGDRETLVLDLLGGLAAGALVRAAATEKTLQE